jgi:predicted nucleic acid-binding protein
VILLDTSVLSRILRRQRPGPAEHKLRAVFEHLVAADRPMGLPGIVLQEVLSGVRSTEQFRDLQARLLGAFPIVIASADDHVEAARLRSLCAGKGTNVSGIDCLIAASAIRGGHELFTTDDDFNAIARHAALNLFDADGQA